MFGKRMGAWTSKADAESIFIEGQAFEQGDGVEKNDVAARKRYEAAAEQNHPAALAALGTFYDTGRGGLEKNAHEAARFYRMASELGNC